MSGLLFPGPERRLLVHGLAGRAEIIVGEDVVDEVLRVLEDRFGDHPAISEALEWLQRLSQAFELVPRRAYEAREAALESRVRDRKDIPVLAGALAAGVDSLVSGDKDLLVLRIVEGITIRRTRDILAALERNR
ncbi:MAG: PIN domain-containing protein [Euryarchaeota archaeon]|nr:PIN domain-containing protein [Euryarchaeota archaeon]